MAWAVSSWHIVQARALALGLIGGRDSPTSVLGLDSITFLVLLESIMSEHPDNAANIHKAYEDAAPKPKARIPKGEERAREVARFMRNVGIKEGA